MRRRGKELDVIVYSVGHPNGLIHDVTRTCHGILVDVSGPAIDQMLSEYREYERAVIPVRQFPHPTARSAVPLLRIAGTAQHHDAVRSRRRDRAQPSFGANPRARNVQTPPTTP